jgi:hypothetical protein
MIVVIVLSENCEIRIFLTGMKVKEHLIPYKLSLPLFSTIAYSQGTTNYG